MLFIYFIFQCFHCNSLNFLRLVAKTASPGPEVSVPTLGAWEYHDFTRKMQKNPGVFFSAVGRLRLKQPNSIDRSSPSGTSSTSGTRN